MSHPGAKPSPAEIRARLQAWGQPEHARQTAGAWLAVADNLLVIGFAWGLSHAVTRLAEPGSPVSAVVPALALFAFLLLRAGFGLMAQRLNLATARRIVRHIRRDFTAQALAGRIEARAHLPVLNTLFEDTEYLEAYYARFRPAELQARVVPLIVLGVVASQSWVAAILLVATLIPFVALMALLGMSSAAEATRQLDALSRLSNLLLDRVRALPLILAFGDGKRQTDTVGRAAGDVAGRTLQVLKIAFVTSAVLEFFSALSVALIAVYCGFYLLGELPFRSPEPLTLTTAFFVLALSPELYAPMRRLAAAYHDRQTAVAAAERLMTIRIEAAPVAAEPLAGPPEVGFDNVVVRFPDDPDCRIGPVSFVCAPGSVTCLSGATGAGKTTLLRLLIEPGGQGVTVNGRTVGRDYDVAGQIAYVPQVPPILAGSLRDNLRLANRDSDDHAVMQAVVAFGLGEVVRARGLDGVLDERGSGLSGGERRRLALARAWLKPAFLVLLDEPSADLDAASEDELIGLLPALFAGRTVLMASHSAKLKALADQVVEL